jgi:predicted DNA-binding transcriptional regulator AlpA
MSELFINRKELAAFCGISLSTVNRGIRDNRWPFSAYIRISPRRLIYPRSILREIESRNKEKGAGNVYM